MGVLSCGRNGCEAVMCNRYSYHHGVYLCEECLEEFIGEDYPLTDYSINEFLESNKEYSESRRVETRRKYIEDEFGINIPEN